ncbi:hypothetical protein GN956_G8972 [Arapaima gigas]
MEGVSRLRHFIWPNFKYSSKAVDYKRAGHIAVPVGRCSCCHLHGHHLLLLSSHLCAKFPSSLMCELEGWSR